MYDAMLAETIHLAGHGGDVIEAYTARPLDPGPAGGVVVIHHMPGYDQATKEIVRRFAAEGYNAISPNLHYREAPGASPDDAAAASRAAGGVPDERFLGDTAAAVAWLRGLTSSNGKVGTIGYCSGGRQSFLAACRLPIDAAVDCYGAFVVGSPPPEMGVRMDPVLDQAEGLSGPILGLFGAEDSHPSPDEVQQIDARLTELGKEHDFHVFDGAGHAFFAVDRPSYRVDAATKGWQLIWDFYGRHLAG
ncbi:MAG TPA: dienelactone hydrolase family protein [Acidimicrobiales bacterium]|nr:dienelactone hydrolase family protein [Acidimicrobiales bacterium]